MTDIGVVALGLILANLFFSYKGFTNTFFFDRYKFEVGGILAGKQYDRLVVSGFLHVNWMHLIFNMLSLYAFSDLLEFQLGGLYFSLVYFAGLLGGNLLALWVHRRHGDYSAVGASGAVCGVIFASIALFPGMGVGFFGIPASIPGWLYGIIYVAYSMYGIRSNRDNIGHEAHLGGALAGMLLAVALQPGALAANYLTVLLIAVPTLVFIYITINRPQALLIDNQYFRTHQNHYDPDHQYNANRAVQQKELDRLLEKIKRHGIDSLTEKEKRKLKEYSAN